jgi:WD40 repeat protein
VLLSSLRFEMVHLIFEDNRMQGVVEETQNAAHNIAPTPSPLKDNDTCKILSCCNVTSISEGKNPSYVFKVACNSSQDALVASTSDNIIKVFSLSGADMALACSMTGHRNTITDVSFSGSPNSFHSSALDGTIRGWDLRSRQCTARYLCSNVNILHYRSQSAHTLY